MDTLSGKIEIQGIEIVCKKCNSIVPTIYDICECNSFKDKLKFNFKIWASRRFNISFEKIISKDIIKNNNLFEKHLEKKELGQKNNKRSRTLLKLIGYIEILLFILLSLIWAKFFSGVDLFNGLYYPLLLGLFYFGIGDLVRLYRWTKTFFTKKEIASPLQK